VSIGEREKQRRRTEQDKGSYAGGVHFCVGIEEAGVFDGESVVKADVAGDAKGEAWCGVEGELDDGDACVGEGHDVEVCLWGRSAGRRSGGERRTALEEICAGCDEVGGSEPGRVEETAEIHICRGHGQDV